LRGAGAPARQRNWRARGWGDNVGILGHRGSLQGNKT
jgi:hypothetical protein